MHKLLAERLKRYVQQSGLTYDALVEKTSHSRSTLYRYINDPPETPNPDIVESIAVATGHTKQEIYEGIEALPTETSEYVAEIVEAENQQLKQELSFERNLQQSIVDRMDRLIETFGIESRKNDAMLEELRTHNDELNTHLTDTHSKLYKVNRHKNAWMITTAVLAVLLAIVGMYAFYAFIAFDMQTPTKGLWPPFWLR